MVGKRSYGDPCGTARALDVIGERWALLVVRELMFGPKRFTELSRGLPAMSQNVLAARLRELESSGVVRNHRLGPPASTRVYELTEHGYALEPVLLALGRWGGRIPLDTVDADAQLSVDGLVLALKTTFDPALADGLAARIGLDFAGDRFTARVAEGGFTVRRGTSAEEDAVLVTDAATLRSVVFGGRPLVDVVSAGEIACTGDLAAARRFTRCFPRPVPIA